MALKDIFSFLFQSSAQEERVAQYVVREHDRGRPLKEILEDKYVVNRLEEKSSASGMQGVEKKGLRGGVLRQRHFA